MTGPFLDHLGLRALFASSRDSKILCAQRFIRLFAYAGTTIILALHLSKLGNSDTKVGLFMTLTLLGDLLLSLAFTFTADRLGRRNVLLVGAIAITASGMIFVFVDNFWILLAGATVGVISPTANEIGPFRAIEESIIAHLTPLADRSDVYSWYSLIGILGQAMGTLACGAITQMLESKKHWPSVQAYRVIFFAYSMIGVLKFILTMMLSSACELDRPKKQLIKQKNVQKDHARSSEERPLLGEDAEGDQTAEGKKSWLGFEVRKDSVKVLVQVSFLQAVEAVAIGLLVSSWVSFYFNDRFGLQEGKLGIIFLLNYLFSAFANIGASYIAKSLGIAKTMTYFNLVAAAFTALIPVPSHSAAPAIIFYLLKSCMNVIGLRSAFVASMYLPAERTAFLGITNVVRTSGSSVGPIITGAVAEADLFWLAFVLGAAIIAAYAVGIYILFGNRPSREETVVGGSDDEGAQEADGPGSGDEEHGG